jgi:phosphoribosylglycinamide formyltransferase-1
MVNIVVLVSGSGSNLQAIIDQIASGELPVRIDLVVSNNPDAYALKRAKSANIDASCIDHRSFSSRLEFDQALIDKIDQVKPDLLVLAGFMRILTTEFVAHYHNRLINIHPSLLPKYPGTDTHQRAIDANDAWHGVSIHFVVPEVDAGPVIVQGRFGIKINDTPETLKQRISLIEHKLYPLAVKWYAQDRLTISAGKVLLDGETASDQLQSFDL